MKISKSNLIIYIIACIVSLICIGLFFIDKDSAWCILSCSIGASGIGAVVLALTLEISNNKIKEDQDIKKERSRILKYSDNLKYFISKYIYYFNALSLDLGDRGNINTEEMLDPDFCKFTQLYHPSLLLSDAEISVLERFYEFETVLRDTFNTIHRDVEFKFYHQFENDIATFVKISFENNMKDYLTKEVFLSVGSKKIKDLAIDMIKDYGNQIIVDFDKGGYRSNVITPYVIFYHTLIQEKEALNKIKQDFKKIELNEKL